MTAEAVEKNADAKSTYKKLTAEQTQASLKQARLQKMTPALETAAQAIKELQVAVTTKGASSKAEAQEKLSTAVFGSAGKSAETTTATDLTTATTPQAPNGLCGGSAGAATVKSIAGLLMCICSKTDNSNGIDGAFIRHAQSNTAVSGDFTNINTLLPV
uniref:Variant surface glycoprotein n=1 Tax=Trypanosoma brucei TaxID=5691 RepID=A0A1V0FYR5_9TRYP|nr:variant surface glycoprotein [Trypanosoma brucei]